MKNMNIVLPLLFAVYLFAAPPVLADPRMETNNNFCHFILNPDNTDNEIFVAGCDSVITVVEKKAAAGNIQIQCDENNYTASGYAKVTKDIPQAAAPVSPGTTLTFTSDDSSTPCTMVESNGRAYQSTKWQSTIKVTGVKKKGYVTVQYELFCQDGHQ